MNEGIYQPHVLVGFAVGHFLRTTGPYLLIKLRALWLRQPCSFDFAYLKEAVMVAIVLAGAGGFLLPTWTVGWPPLAQTCAAIGVGYIGQDFWRKLLPLLQSMTSPPPPRPDPPPTEPEQP